MNSHVHSAALIYLPSPRERPLEYHLLSEEKDLRGVQGGPGGKPTLYLPCDLEHVLWLLSCLHQPWPPKPDTTNWEAQTADVDVMWCGGWKSKIRVVAPTCSQRPHLVDGSELRCRFLGGHQSRRGVPSS